MAFETASGPAPIHSGPLSAASGIYQSASPTLQTWLTAHEDVADLLARLDVRVSKARAEIKLHERIARRELEREGPLRRVKPLVAGSAEVRVLVAIAERKGVVTQAELVAPGLGKSIVSKAFRSLRRRKLIQSDARTTSVTLFGWTEAKRLGAEVTFRQSDWRHSGF